MENSSKQYKVKNITWKIKMLSAKERGCLKIATDVIFLSAADKRKQTISRVKANGDV